MCILLLSDHHMSNIMTHNQHLLDSCILTEQATLEMTTNVTLFNCDLNLSNVSKFGQSFNLFVLSF